MHQHFIRKQLAIRNRSIRRRLARLIYGSSRSGDVLIRATRQRLTTMDDLLLVMIIAGIGLSGAYLRAELILRRRLKTAECRRELDLRKLHINRRCLEQTAVPKQSCNGPSTIQINLFQVKGVSARALGIFIEERNAKWNFLQTRDLLMRCVTFLALVLICAG